MEALFFFVCVHLGNIENDSTDSHHYTTCTSKTITVSNASTVILSRKHKQSLSHVHEQANIKVLKSTIWSTLCNSGSNLFIASSCTFSTHACSGSSQILQ